MICSVFVKLDFTKSGYVYTVYFAVMAAVNCASVVTVTAFVSTINDFRHNSCGGQNSLLTSPCKNNTFPSAFVGVAPMGLDPTPPLLPVVYLAHLPEPLEPGFPQLV